MTIPRIAVISRSVTDGIDHCRDNYNIREIQGHNRMVISQRGIVYDIITDPAHLRGNEYTEIKVTNHAYLNPHFEEIRALAVLRVR